MRDAAIVFDVASYVIEYLEGTYARISRSFHALAGSHDSGSVTRAMSRWRASGLRPCRERYACSFLYRRILVPYGAARPSAVADVDVIREERPQASSSRTRGFARKASGDDLGPQGRAPMA
jgi:hypothetical protein